MPHTGAPLGTLLRRTAPTVAAVLAALCLTACGDKAPESSGAPSATAEPSSPTAPTPTTSAAAAAPFREDFDSPAALAQWTVSEGDRHSGGPPSFAIEDGELRVVSAHASWLNQRQGFGLARRVSGDVDITARVRVTGVSSPTPDIAWSLAGIMLRDPAVGPEDWIHWTVGEVGGPVLERKRTTSGRSILELVELSDAAPVDLRIIRVGELVVLAHRQHAQPWTVDHTYGWADLPTDLDLLLTAQSGGVGDHADLVAYTDFVEVAPADFDAAETALLEARDAAPLNH